MSDHYLVRIFESELNVIADETCGHEDIETGGSLFGLFSHGGGPTVFLATRPTARAVRGQTTLELDPVVTRALEQQCWEGFGVQGIGMWHSHHWIALYEPSGGDRERTRRYAEKYQRPQYTEILANFVDGSGQRGRRSRSRGGETLLRLTPFYYLDARNLTRVEASLVVLPGESPLRRMLSGSDLGPDLADSLRAAAGKPRLPCDLAESAASEPSWLQRITRRSSGSPVSPEHDDLRALEHPSDLAIHDDPGAGARPGPAERTAPPDQSVCPDEAVDGNEAARPGQAVRPDEAARGDQGGRDEETGPLDGAGVTVGPPRLAQPPLLPIPDLPAYVRDFLEPLMSRLPSRQYEVSLEPYGQKHFMLILRTNHRETRFFFVTGWDGTQPVVVTAQLKLEGRADLVWQPMASGEIYELERALVWGLDRLRDAP